jgi:hypothetical protein
METRILATAAVTCALSRLVGTARRRGGVHAAVPAHLGLHDQRQAAHCRAGPAIVQAARVANTKTRRGLGMTAQTRAPTALMVSFRRPMPPKALQGADPAHLASILTLASPNALYARGVRLATHLRPLPASNAPTENFLTRAK